MSKNERNIVVYYFLDATRMAVVSGTTRWYKYPRSAKSSAHDAMDLNLYGANVAVVYDDANGKDLYIFTRDVNGNVVTAHTAEAMKQKNLGTTRDPFGDFTKKLSRTAKNRGALAFVPKKNKRGRK
jgi:hypothetical protein